MNELPDRDLRVDEVAAYYGVTRQCVYLWIDNKKLIAQPRPGKPMVILRESIIEWEKQLAKRSSTAS